MTLDDVCDALVSACAEAGGREAWGRQHGFTRSFLSSVLLRKRAPSVRLLAALGLERVVTTTVSYRQALKAMVPYPEFCHQPELCRIAGRCTAEIVCND